MEKKIKKFDAEVGKILNLVINSIYVKKDIFLRELISNSSDACDKLRYESIKKPYLTNKEHKYQISIEIKKSDNKIILSDTGIGMNEDELIDNIGTIAKSGTENFISQISNNKDKGQQLIGQFGVGFYSVFMVSEDVTIISRKAGEKQSYFWYSNGKGKYVVGKSKEIITGTKIILKIKPSEKKFLEEEKIKKIVLTYSNHILWPIKIVSNEGGKYKEEVINLQKALWLKKSNKNR